jgi:outer membrane protein OmpA-like peptidoglycan-associated protein
VAFLNFGPARAEQVLVLRRVSCHGKRPTAEGEGVAMARLWWFAAMLAVPAVLAGFALLWAGPPAPAAPPLARASVLPVAPSSGPPTASVVAADPTAAEPPDPTLAQVAEVLAAQPIRFTADSSVLAGPPAATVQRVAELLVAGPVVPVLVEGHVADTPGGPDVVQRLSDQRAAVVVEALVAAGVPAERITARGAGATRPLATAEESRRVEITFG